MSQLRERLSRQMGKNPMFLAGGKGSGRWLGSCAGVARLLKALDWTRQLPLERAIPCDEETIEHWRTEVWPEFKTRR
jgi:hypothetical protein